MGHLAQSFDLDRGIVGTTVELFRHPHRVVADYLRGRTVPYTNPVKHFALALSITQVIALASGATSEFASGLTEGMSDSANTAKQVVAQLDRFFLILAAPSVLVLAAVQRLVFRRWGWNFAEHLASALFLAGNHLLLWVPSLLLASGTWSSAVGKVVVAATLLASLVYYIVAVRGLGGASIGRSVVQSVVVTSVSTTISMILLAVALGLLVV